MSKIERWSEEVRAKTGMAQAQYLAMSFRELVILTTAEIDIALAELLAKRLGGKKEAKEKFLGFSGQAPGGDFSARIELAWFTGVINEIDRNMLHALRDLRNKCAHRIVIKPDDLQSFLDRLKPTWIGIAGGLDRVVGQSEADYQKEIVYTVFLLFQHTLWAMLKFAPPIEELDRLAEED